MKYQKNLAFVLLASLPLQSCGVDEPGGRQVQHGIHTESRDILYEKHHLISEESTVQASDAMSLDARSQYTYSAASSTSYSGTTSLLHQPHLRHRRVKFQSMQQVQIGLQDENASIRIAALLALVEKEADVQELLPPILNALKDSNADVRSTALQALPTLVEKGADVQLLVPPILNALKDSDSDVRMAALQALPTLVEKDADVQVLLPPILNALKDSHWNVRRAALKSLPTLVGKEADVQVLLRPILNALKDRHLNVRSAAREALPTLVRKEADVQVLLCPILNALKDRNADVRSAAREALPTIVEKGTDVQAMITHILNALQDSNADVRSAAREALRTLVEKGADVQAMVTHMFNALKDSNWRVRRAALKALPTLVKKGTDVAEILIRLREVWGKDTSYEIRCITSRVLAATVLNHLKGVEAISDKNLIEQILSISEKMLSDSQDRFREEALDNLENLYRAIAPSIKSDFTSLGIKTLQDFSTEELINMYWLRPSNKVIVHFIVSRIYAIPLISQGSEEDSKWRLVLYLDVGDAIIWEKEKEAVRNFEKLVQDDIKERMQSTLNSSTSDDYESSDSSDYEIVVSVGSRKK